MDRATKSTITTLKTLKHRVALVRQDIKAGGGGSGRVTSDDGTMANTTLQKHGFQHMQRASFPDGSKVDVYKHPAGHTAAVKVVPKEKPQWAVNYNRGLGNPSGTGSADLNDHLVKSEDFLNSEASQKPMRAAAVKADGEQDGDGVGGEIETDQADIPVGEVKASQIKALKELLSQLEAK